VRGNRGKLQILRERLRNLEKAPEIRSIPEGARMLWSDGLLPGYAPLKSRKRFLEHRLHSLERRRFAVPGVGLH
jgi:hypothetical protein